MILALDPGRMLGFCSGQPGGTLEYGHIELAPRAAAPGAIGFALGAFLKEIIVILAPDLIVYEQPFLSPNFRTAFELLGIAFYIDAVATEYGIEYASAISIEATKALTGIAKFPGKDYHTRRKAKKLATVEACRARGWEATEDEADAIAIFLLAESKRFPEASALRRPLFKDKIIYSDGRS